MKFAEKNTKNTKSEKYKKFAGKCTGHFITQNFNANKLSPTSATAVHDI